MCSFLVCDIARFSDPSRADPVRRRVRKAMYEGLERSLADLGLRPHAGYHADRGDGAMAVLPPGGEVDSRLKQGVGRLRAAGRQGSGGGGAGAPWRRRGGVRGGGAESDGRGRVGAAATHAVRLLDAEPRREAVAGAETAIGVIVSRRVYEDVVSHGRAVVDPGDYYPV